mgnify:CR=1 FL=1
MSFDFAPPLPWHDSLWTDISQSINNDRLSHAMLFSGLSGIGKRHLALSLAGRLLCSDSASNQACGHCKSCELVAAGTHPDFSLLEPIEEGKVIPIADVRKLISVIDKTSQLGGWKIAVIHPAESMSNGAANALLTSLEEPQGKTLIILVSHRPSLLPATIRSRCQIKTMLPPSIEVAKTWLRAIFDDHEDTARAIEISKGRPLLALDYLKTGGLNDYEGFERVLEAVRLGDISFIDAAQQCSKLTTSSSLEWFISYLHYLLKRDEYLQSNQNIYLFADRLNQMHQLVVSGNNINQQLMWEELFMSWRQVFFKQ